MWIGGMNCSGRKAAKKGKATDYFVFPNQREVTMSGTTAPMLPPREIAPSAIRVVSHSTLFFWRSSVATCSAIGCSAWARAT